MAYNRISNQSYYFNNNVTGSNLIVSGNKLTFTNNFLISDVIDQNLQNEINNIQIKNDTLFLSSSLILQSGSVLTGITLLNTGSRLIFSNSIDSIPVSYLGLTDLLTDENIILKNVSGSIFISGNISSNNDTFFNNQVSGSIIYIDENEQNLLLKSNGGGLTINVVTESVYNDKYYEISSGISNSSNNVNALTSLNTLINITYLSNKKEYCLNKNAINYEDNKDIFVVKGNNYPQFTWNNNLLNTNTSDISNFLGNIWSNNNKNLSNPSSYSKYKNIPQCIILRPGNDKDNIDTYFSGDAHYIKIKNDDNVYPGETNINNENLSSLFILDLTNPNYVNELQRGFKWEILLDNFKNSVFNIKTNETSSILPGTLFTNLENASFTATTPINVSNFLYTNYIPWEYNSNIDSIDINYPIGNGSILNPIANPNLVNIKKATGAAYPDLTKYTNGQIFNGFFDSPTNTIPYKYIIGPYRNIGAGTFFINESLVKSSVNLIYLHAYSTNLGVNLLTPLNPIAGDFFYVQILQDNTDITRSHIKIKNNDNTLNLFDLYYKKTPINSYTMKIKKYDLTNQNTTYEYTNVTPTTPSVKPVDCTFRFEYNGTEWISNDFILNDTTRSVNPNKPLFYQDFAFDFGGLQYPTLFAVELPPGHYITDFSNTKQTSWNGHNIYTHKNNNDFYLWGDKTNFESWQSNLTNPSSWKLNGGWLRSLTLPNSQVEKKEVVTLPNVPSWFFKKIYKNFYLVVANTALNANLGFNWSNSFSNFQLVYIGNNEWIIT